MDGITLLSANLLSPPVVAFGAGLAAFWVRSEFKFPAQLYEALTIYLLIAIGFKGGASLVQTPFAQLLLPIVSVLAVGSLIPLLAFTVSRKILKYSVDDAAALAAHYGSVSAVTFMACLAFLDYFKVPYENFMPALMALMEIPAIAVGLFLFNRFSKQTSGNGGIGEALREVFAGKSIFLLVTGLLAGAAAGPIGMERARPFLIDPFYGVLILFLLEMGITTGRQLGTIRSEGMKLALFATILPILNAMLGLGFSMLCGFSVGGATVFMVLCASASYIAAPAAIRIAIPNANPGKYITSSLGITFPFNLVVGIPLYYMIATAVIG
jgi:hypothetical protein